MLLALQYPSWIHPEVIPGFYLLRWYGLMYLVAFFVAFVLFKVQVKKGELAHYSQKVQHDSQQVRPIADDDVLDFFTWTIFGLLIGARIFATLVYDTTNVYWFKPWLIFWPFSQDGQWTGLQGMSYHGGFLGAFIGSFLWTKRHKQPFLAWVDTACAAIPLGYTFGRLGNFLNGELYGRITASPIGMIFPSIPLHDYFSAQEVWVQEFAAQAGIVIPAGAQLVNLPRHPSQLYEAFFEGIVLWILLWSLRNKKPFNGFVLCMYSIGYGTVRFFIEYFRQPDYELGFRISDTPDASIYLYHSWKNISTGQILCVLMIAGGLAGLALLAWYNRRVQNRTADSRKKHANR